MKFNFTYKHILILFVIIFSISIGVNAQTYCSTSYANGTGSGDYISLVEIPSSTLNSASGGAGTPFYTLFPATGSSTGSLQRGNTTAYSLKVAGGTNAVCYIAAWGDWNHNGVFETWEFIGVSPNAGNNTTVSFTNGIKIPDSAYVGTTRLRFRSSATSPGPSGSQSCNATNSTDGEAEDYIITITCQLTTAPTAGFTILTDSVFVKSPVRMVNNNTSYLVSNRWYINGVYSAGSTDLQYAFQSPGSYDVCLKSSNCFGSDSICSTVNVYFATQKPIIDFSGGFDTALAEQILKYKDLTTKGPVYWNWTVSPMNGVEFVNGTNANSQNPEIQFHHSGNFIVCMWDSNALGRSAIKCKSILVLHKLCIFPFDATESSGILTDANSKNSTCTFSLNPCASVVNLTFSSFNLPANSYLRIYNGKDNTAPPLFPGSGYTGTSLPGGGLGVTAGSGKMYIEFINGANAGKFMASWSSLPSNDPPPSGKLIMPDTVDNCGTLLTFTYASSSPLFDSTQADFKWTFTSALNPPTVYQQKGFYTGVMAFATPGSYFVRLDVTNCGGTQTIYDTLIVISATSAPVIDFKANILTATTTDVITLTDLNKFDPLSRVWTISGPGTVIPVNGNTSTRNYSVRLNSPGTYTVQLKDDNCIGSTTLAKTAYIKIVSYCSPAVGSLNTDFCILRFKLGKADSVVNNIFYGLDYTNANTGTTTYRDNTNKVTNYTIGTYTFTNIPVEARVAIGDSIPFSITRLNNFNNTNFKIWIDYNQDGTFQSTELAAYSGLTGVLTYSGYIRIPISTKSGATRLRIGTSLDNTTNEACGLNFFGDFNDYRIIIYPGIIKPNNSDTVYVEVGRQFNNPGITIFGAMSVIHSGLAFGSTITTYPSLNTHTIIATDSLYNSTTKRIQIKATADTTKPVIIKIGSDTVYAEVGVAYTDVGATATDFYFGSLTSLIVPTSNVNINLLGTYKVRYNVKDAAGNSAVEVIRTVIVRDIKAPTLQLLGNDTLMVNVKTLTVAPEPGYTLSDNYYFTGQLIVNVDYSKVNLNVLGFYPAKYYVSDPSGNMDSSVIRTYHVVDTTRPVITLIGNAFYLWKRWKPYVDPGNTVTDNYYSNLICTPDISKVDINIPGIYEVTFDVTDSSGNKATQVKRLLEVDAGIGINEGSDKSIFSVYPNPSSSELNIKFKAVESDFVSLSIYGTDGKLVYENDKMRPLGNKLKIDLRNLNPGIYYIKINADQFTAVKSFSIIR